MRRSQKTTMATPSSIILSHVPRESRASLFSGLICALEPNDKSSIDFVASAVIEQGDDEALKLLAGFLLQLIESGRPESAVSIAVEYQKIGGSFFAHSSAILSQAKFERQDAEPRITSIASHLRFCKSLFLLLPVESAHAGVLSASVELLVNTDQSVCHAARDLIFAVLLDSQTSTTREVVRSIASSLWDQVQQLIQPECNKQDQVLGYSLWLRWLLAVEQAGIDLSSHIDELYWDHILHGLRRGDAEIRKLCLNILKLSLVAESNRIDTATRTQFERYATVFETIVLGRYINQIQECEGDLDDLVSASSAVGLKWLYTLIASGLDSQMQESNRKFIGGWVMRAGLHSGTQFQRFLRDDFLPWATQGSLFVGALKRDVHGNASCSHGDRLSDYLAHVLRHLEHDEEVRSTTWSYVTSKKTFTYAKVWLLKALSECHTAGSSTLHGTVNGEVSSEQITRGLPDAARDYVSKKLAELGASVPFEPIMSRRDTLEEGAIAKCSSVDTMDALDDLWSDLDYLEYPKNLLFRIPAALLSARLVDKALKYTDLASSLRDRVSILQKVAETKTYIIPPLDAALRSAVLRTPQAFDLLGMEDYIIGAVDNPPEPTIDLMLEEATIHLFSRYEDYLGERPSNGIAALFDLVSRINDPDQLQDLIGRLLQRWKAQKIPPPTVSTWKTALQLQTLLLCLENLQPTLVQAKETVMDLLHILSIEPLPRYRYLLEWMVVRLLQRMELDDIVLDQLASKDHHSNPKFLASLMKIGSIIGCSDSSSEAFATRLATLYVPLGASSKIVIRHEAQWQAPILLEHARSKGWSSITDNAALTALDDYIRSLERFHEPPLERKIGRFDPETHHTLTNLVEGAWFGLDSIEAPLTSRNAFVKLHAQQPPADCPESCMVLGDAIPQHHPPAPSNENRSATTTAPTPRTIDDVAALQTKGTAHLARTLSDAAASAARPNNLIVVGSLVDNPYNLGGLSRVSEIFGASALTLQNQNVIGNKDFTSVSVSSHLHFPIIQLSAPGVPAFLAERKGEGFTVVGIEQTDRSVILGSKEAMLPEKCVLVVGSEKEGIPAVVLTECDVLVEIPQNGVTRSLNVQTAVSVVLFEYARQRGK